MSLVTVDELKALVNSSLSDDELQAVIDREEAAVFRAFGPHYAEEDDEPVSVTETLQGGTCNLYLRRALTDVVSVTPEDCDALDADDYRVWPNQGRIERRPAGTQWEPVVTVEYTPAEDTLERTSVIIDLCRLAISRTAYRQESIGGDYSVTAPDWEAERALIMRRLSFVGV